MFLVVEAYSTTGSWQLATARGDNRCSLLRSSIFTSASSVSSLRLAPLAQGKPWQASSLSASSPQEKQPWRNISVLSVSSVVRKQAVALRLRSLRHASLAQDLRQDKPPLAITATASLARNPDTRIFELDWTRCDCPGRQLHGHRRALVR